MTWMKRLHRVFDIDLRHFPHCSAPLRVLAVTTDPAAIVAILARRDTHAARSPLLPHHAQ